MKYEVKDCDWQTIQSNPPLHTIAEIRITPDWIADITVLSAKARYTKNGKFKGKRYYRLKGKKYLEIDSAVMYNHVEKRGYYILIPKPYPKGTVKRFIRQIEKSEGILSYLHDKTWLFPNGVLEQGYTEKQLIEHLFGGKRSVYCKLKKGLIKNASEFIQAYKILFAKLSLTEVRLSMI